MTSSPLAADEALWQRAWIVSTAEAALEEVGSDIPTAFSTMHLYPINGEGSLR